MDASDISIILLKFSITFIISLLFGLDRQLSHKPIGFGTFIFVAVGSCGLAITASLISENNPLPLLSAIITGIGFLGAGAILKTSDKIFGFTTAASIWVFAIIGLIIGVGQYLVGFIICAFVWAVILVDKSLRKKGLGSYQKRILITATKNIFNEELLSLLGTKKYKMIDVDINKKDSKYTVTLLVEGTKHNINCIPKRLFEDENIISFKME